VAGRRGSSFQKLSHASARKKRANLKPKRRKGGGRRKKKKGHLRRAFEGRIFLGFHQAATPACERTRAGEKEPEIRAKGTRRKGRGGGKKGYKISTRSRVQKIFLRIDRGKKLPARRRSRLSGEGPQVNAKGERGRRMGAKGSHINDRMLSHDLRGQNRKSEGSLRTQLGGGLLRIGARRLRSGRLIKKGPQRGTAWRRPSRE